MKFKIFYKFLFLILFFAMLPLLWLGINLTNKAEFSIKTPISELHINLVEKIKKSFYLKIEKFDDLSNLIDTFFKRNLQWDVRATFLSSIISSMPEIKLIGILNLYGDEILRVSEKNASSKIIFKKTPTRAIIIDKNYIALIYNKGGYYLYFELDYKKFINGLDISKIGEKSVLIMVNNKLEIEDLSGSYQKAYNCVLKNENFLNYIRSKIDAAVEFECGGDNYLGAITYIPEISASIASLQVSSDAYKYAMSIKKEAIKIIVFFALAVIVISYILSRGLSSPLIKIIEAAKRVSEKDFSVRVNLKTKDELEDLAETFNKMVESLDAYSKLQIEKILRERQNTQAIMYSTEEGIIMVDLEMRVQLINRKALFIIDCNEENFENRNIYEIINDEVVEDAIKKAFESEKKQVEFEKDFKTYKRFYRISIGEIKIRDKELIGHLITFYDITYDKELEKIKEDFLHAITHDLRNPVSAIKGFSEFLLKEIAGPLNPNQKNMVVSIDRAAFRLLQMVNNILDIAKMEAGKMELNLTRFNVYNLVKNCVDLMSSLAVKKNITFVIDGDKNIEIVADANLIERIYINLIGNAIKFTPQDGKITIGFAIVDGKFRSWVKDTGEGIPPEYIDKIFAKFEQVKGQKAGGTGLGLTISKYIAEAHLGKIWAESKPGSGAKFIFEFPLNLKKDEFGRIVAG